MPGLSGLGLAAQAHQIRPKLPVMFMSGFAQQYEDELSGPAYGIKLFLEGGPIGTWQEPEL